MHFEFNLIIYYKTKFLQKRDVLDRVSNLLNSAKKEKDDRCVSFSSFYKNNSTPASRRSRVHSMQVCQSMNNYIKYLHA